jgi:Arc/MetJ-type ribon-helix-helix transcriptional regulator
VVKGWTTVALKDQLVTEIDRFLEARPMGYSNRAEVVTAAVRSFLAEGGRGSSTREQVREELVELFQALEHLRPKTTRDLILGALRELDRGETPHREPPVGATGKPWAKPS